MNQWLSVTLAVTLLLCVSYGQTVVTVNVGLLVQTSGPECVTGSQFQRAVSVAESRLRAQTWFPTDVAINTTVLHASTPFDAFEAATDYLTSMADSNLPVAALLGPVTSDGVVHARFVGSRFNVPVIDFSATAGTLTTELEGEPTGTLFRVCNSDVASAAALRSAVSHFGWKRMSVVYVRNEFGRAFFELIELINSRESGISLTHELPFESENVAEVDEALNVLEDSTTRIVILACDADDARLILKRAHARGMTGKGWTWIGDGWVSADTWLEADTDADVATVRSAMAGSLGVQPNDGTVQTYLDGLLSRYVYTPGESAEGDPVQCPELVSDTVSSSPGVPAHAHAVYAFDAMWVVGNVATAVRAGCASAAGCVVDGAAMKSVLGALGPGGVAHASPITGPVAFLSNGDRSGVDLDLVNADGTTVRRVADWLVGDPSPGATPQQALLSGQWHNFNDIAWPGHQRETPSDRVIVASRTEAFFFFLSIFGVGMSIVIGNVLRRHQIRKLPESGAAVLVGVLFGLLLRIISDSELTDIAEFDPTVFAMVFLPIIIFESGYVLRKHPFFTQLGTIAMFALLGTLLASVLTGSLLYALSRAGLFTAFSLEECLAVGALVSATDPVATLSVFQALGVDPRLYAIVYGEAVINDAVGIVLFHSFSRFISEEVTSSGWGDAVGSFFGVLFGSVVVGMAVGVGMTLLLKFVRIAKAPGASGVTEVACLTLTAYGSFSLAEAIGLSGIVSSLFCGITVNHYTLKAMSPAGVDLGIKYFRLLAHLFEIAVFWQVGLNIVLFIGVFDAGFTFAAFVLVIVARAAHVFPLGWLLNLCRSQPLPKSHLVQLWHSGLRGAIAYALSIQFPSQHQDRVINTTSLLIMATIFCLGGTTPSMLNALGIAQGVADDDYEADKRMARQEKRNSRLKACVADADRKFRSCLYRRDASQTARRGPPAPLGDQADQHVVNPDSLTLELTETGTGAHDADLSRSETKSTDPEAV